MQKTVRSVTSRYHGSKFLDLREVFLVRDCYLHCRTMEEKYDLQFVPESNHHTSRHVKVFVFFLPFTGPRFVEIQRFFYHGNVMKRLLLSIKPCTDFGTV